MKRKIPALAAVLLAVAAIGLTVYATAGTAADYFVSLLHLEEIFVKPVRASAQSRADALAQSVTAQLDAAFNSQADYALGVLNESLAQRIYDRVAQKVAQSSSLNVGTMQKVALQKGDRIVGPPGAGVMLLTGESQIYGSANSSVLNITAGEPRVPGTPMGGKVYYMIVAQDGSGVIVTSATAEFYIRDGASVIKAYTPVHTGKADTLRGMGLFVGTDFGYELDRPPTRQESLIMLIRLLGEEQMAVSYMEPSKFTDLLGWEEGKRYISYGHAKGYTDGISPTAFGQYSFSTVEMYLTFVLRALGYNDLAGDFVWNTTSRDLAIQVGLVTQSDLDIIDKTGIMRDHVVQISFNALFAKLKGSDLTLGGKLVNMGVISERALAAARP